MAHHVFISYRRKGGAELARLLYDRLQSDGYKPFYDIMSMESGYFDLQIYDRINECSCVLVLLSPNALEPAPYEEDWFLTEITHAMQQEKTIIPILMHDFKWPERSSGVIDHLRHCHGIEETMDYFNAFYSKIKSIIPYTPTAQEAALPMTVQMEKRLRMADMLLENGNFSEAEDHLRTLLEYDLECGAAYLGLTMVQHKIRNREAFRDYYSRNILYDHINIKLAREHGDPQTREYLNGLSLPVCQNHRNTAKYRCAKCGALLCGDCASHLQNCGDAWFSDKILCPDCVDLIHKESLEIGQKNKFDIFLRFLGIAAFLALLPAVLRTLSLAFSFEGIAIAFLVESCLIGGFGLLLTRPPKASSNPITTLLASAINGMIVTPCVLLYWLFSSLFGLWVMHSALKGARTAREQNKDVAQQYASAYIKMARVHDVLHDTKYLADCPDFFKT